ncbi:hypothetical protein ACP4OV_029013 [Aristida adscensionis]
MATLSTIAPSSQLSSWATMASSYNKNFSWSGAPAKRTASLPAGNKDCAHRRYPLPPLASKNRSNGRSVLRCSMGGVFSWPSPLSLQERDSDARAASVNKDGGIGIKDFLGGKNFLITGGTGFLAKALIEKILRTNPDVGKIYVILKGRNTEEAIKRLQNELVDTELFKCLQKIHGKEYHSFVARKLVPVIGDIREANLGIGPELMNEITESVDIIVHSAGNTNFHERYDVAMDVNTLGPFRLMSFAQRFQRLKLFLHMSTAYVNGRRQGVVLEKPFRLGDTIAKELECLNYSEHDGAELDMEAEIKLTLGSGRQNHDSPSFYKEMVDLGLQRATLHGWHDTYVFTKAMGEMVINSMRGEIPVVIIRPTIIESTLKDPFPGWIQGNRVADPVIINYGKGLTTCFPSNPDCVLDLIPADMVVNATLASMAKHSRRAQPAADINVYHLASSTANPLPIGDVFRYMFRHFSRSPLTDTSGEAIPVKPIQPCHTMEEYADRVELETGALLRQRMRRRGGGGGAAAAAASAERLVSRAREQMLQLGRMYEPYTFYGARFDSANTAALLAEMSPEERESFPFDVRGVDWEDYITNVHIPGLKKHILKGRGVGANEM